MPVTLTQQVPAFRMDDAALRSPHAGEARARVSEAIDELRRASERPRPASELRAQRLVAAGRWLPARQLRRSGGGAAATVEASAPEAPWCREVVDAVLDLLRRRGRPQPRPVGVDGLGADGLAREGRVAGRPAARLAGVRAVTGCKLTSSRIVQRR